MPGGDKQSLTQQLNIVRKLRDMGAVRISVGDLFAEFRPEPAPSQSDEELDAPQGYVDDSEALDATQKWYRNGSAN